MFNSLSFVPSFVRIPLMAMATLTTMGLTGCGDCHADEMRRALGSCDNAHEFQDRYCGNIDPMDQRTIRDCKAVSTYIFRQCIYPDHYEECTGKDYGHSLICDCMNFGKNMFGPCPTR